MPELTAAMTVYICILTAVLGLCMGSFLNCFAYRYAKRESAMKGRSYCALCGHTLSALELLPVLSWLLLRGRCRHCGGRISSRYLWAELVCGLCYLSLLLRFGLSMETGRYLLLATLLAAAAFSDLYCGLIPDRVILLGTAAAFGLALFPAEGSVAASLLWTLVNGLSISLPLFLLVLLFDRVMGRDTMGGGDLKLIFLIGLFFDWKQSLLLLILACVLGIAFALLRRPTGEKHGQAGAFSFAPSLALAAWAVMLWGGGVIAWYTGLFRL